MKLITTLVVVILAQSVAFLYAYEIPAHRRIVVEAARVWADTPQEIIDHLSGENEVDNFCFADYDPRDDIYVGSAEEDLESTPLPPLAPLCGIINEHTTTNEGRNGFLEHFWNPDFPITGPTGVERRGYNCEGYSLYNLGLFNVSIFPACGDHFDSAYRLAQDIWDNKVIPFYRQGRIGEAYYWLGRVAHLLSDMGVPAHVQLRPHDPIISSKDLYEDFVDEGMVKRIARRVNIRGREYRFECLPNLPCDFDWSRIHTNPTNLFKLFWYTAQKTQYWAGMNKKGLASFGNEVYSTFSGSFEVFKPTLWNGKAIPFQDPVRLKIKSQRKKALRQMSDALIPHALKAVAGLYRLFWLETHPEIGPVVFQGLGVDFFPSGFSFNGSVIVGQSFTSPSHALRWTEANGLEALTELPGATSSGARDVSRDGSVIVGLVTGLAGAFRWTETTGMEDIGDIAGGAEISSASAVSADGSVVVGTGHSGIVEAFRWTRTEGMTGLGTLGGFPASEAFDVSADGSVVVGYSVSSSGREAFRWTEAEGMVGLGDLPGDPFDSIATAVSADGSVVVGQSLVGPNWQAFRWTQSEGMASLGTLPGGGDAGATGVSGDGTLLVGLVNFCCPGFNEAFVWDSVNGMRKLQDVLVNEHGIDLTGWTLSQAAGISDDGRTIVGIGMNPLGQGEVWIVRNFMP